MTIDIDAEELVHFADAPPCWPGRKPGQQSLHRWRLNGVMLASGERAYLETIKVSGLRYTSKEAIRRFIAAQNAPSSATAPAVTHSQHQRQAVAANEQLKAEFGSSPKPRRRHLATV